MKGDQNILSTAIAVLIEFVILTELIVLTRRAVPRLTEKQAKIIGGASVVVILACLYTWGLPSALTVGEKILALLPHIGFGLWAMLVLLFTLQTQANKKNIEELSTAMLSTSKELTNIGEKAFKFADLIAKHETLSLENKWMKNDLEAKQELHENISELRQQLGELKGQISSFSSTNEGLCRAVSELQGAPSWTITSDGPVQTPYRYPSIEKLNAAIEALDQRARREPERDLSSEGLLRALTKKD